MTEAVGGFHTTEIKDAQFANYHITKIFTTITLFVANKALNESLP